MKLQRNKPVVFLDMDDVFCVHQQYSSGQALEALKRQETNHEIWENLVLAEARINLAKLHLEFLPTYVISSSWSYGLSHSQMRQVLFKTGMDFVAVDLHRDWKTPKLYAPSRIKEIEAWLAKHRHPIRPILILDDYSSGWALQHSRLDKEGYVVFCEVGIGFVSEKLVEAQNLLRAQIPVLPREFKKPSEKILYLDFDGVLHDKEVFLHKKSGIEVNTPGRTLFEWMPLLEELLAPYPDVSIVLSTSWVTARDYAFARKQLSPTLQARVIGATFHSHAMQKEEFFRKPRALQIAEDVQRRAPLFWFALDCDSKIWPTSCADKLIHTNGDKGINDQAIQDSIRLMLKNFE